MPEKSLGAEIMDWADDLTYAVHDVDDFFRAGLVPLDRLRSPNDAEIKTFTARLNEFKEEDPAKFPRYEVDELVEKVREILSLYGPGERYAHTASSRAALREFGSKLITRYLGAFTVENDPQSGEALLRISEDAERDVMALKMLVVVYVIRRPSLAVVQKGQQKVIEELFDTCYKASAPGRKGNRKLFSWCPRTPRGHWGGSRPTHSRRPRHALGPHRDRRDRTAPSSLRMGKRTRSRCHRPDGVDRLALVSRCGRTCGTAVHTVTSRLIPSGRTVFAPSPRADQCAGA